jgi:hypothetical protein
MLSRDHHGPRAILNALDRLAEGYGSECERVHRDLGVGEGQLRDYQARLGKPFLHDGYLNELSCLRDQLKAGLSTTEPKEGEPKASEIAERIKALRAANSVEPAAARSAQPRSVAEEPVTARIRRQAHSTPMPQDLPAIGNSLPAIPPVQEWTERPEIMHSYHAMRGR